MSSEIVSLDVQNLVDRWLEDEQSGNQFPVPFDLAWTIAGYARKDSGKRALVGKNSVFVKDEDYHLHNPVEWSQDGCSSDSISMTCDAFKHFCLMAKTEEGKAVRQYFIEAEKRWRLVQRHKPEVANEIELMQLKIELAKLESQKSQTDLALIQFRHYVTTALPEVVQQKVLGYSTIKNVEYRDRLGCNQSRLTIDRCCAIQGARVEVE